MKRFMKYLLTCVLMISLFSLTPLYANEATSGDVDIFTITFKDRDTVVSSNTYAYEDAVVVPKVESYYDLTWEYRFTSWMEEGTLVDTIPLATKDVTYTAYYERYGHVVFEDGNGNIVSEGIYKEGEKVIVPARLVDRGTLTFDGWDKQVSKTCKGNVVYTAVFTRKPTICLDPEIDEKDTVDTEKNVVVEETKTTICEEEKEKTVVTVEESITPIIETTAYVAPTTKVVTKNTNTKVQKETNKDGIKKVVETTEEPVIETVEPEKTPIASPTKFSIVNLIMMVGTLIFVLLGVRIKGGKTGLKFVLCFLGCMSVIYFIMTQGFGHMVIMDENSMAFIGLCVIEFVVMNMVKTSSK